MANFGSSLWNVLWVVVPFGIAAAGWVIFTAWKKGDWFHYFDPKHNRGFATDAGDFTPHWKRYAGMAKLCVTLSAGAVAFLINLLVNQSSPANGFADRVRQGAPLTIGLFGASSFLLLCFLLWMTYCYEEYCHSKNHDSYRAWKYAVSNALGFMGFAAFLFGFFWLGLFVPHYSVQAQKATTSTAIVSTSIAGNSTATATAQTHQPPPTFSISEWFSSERSLAVATWGLVLVTAFLVVAGWIEGRRQKRQWDAERKQRAEDAKPTAVIEIAVKEESVQDMCFACFNLGNNTFYIDEMIVTTANGRRQISSQLTPLVLVPGGWATIDYDPAAILSTFGEDQPWIDANCVFVLRGATGRVCTEPEWFHVAYGKGRADWRKGRTEDLVPGAVASQPKVLRMPKQNSSDSGQMA